MTYHDLFKFSTTLGLAVANLSNKTLIFNDFPWPTIEFHYFPGLENEILKLHDFPGFPWPVWNLDNVLWPDMMSTQRYQGLFVDTPWILNWVRPNWWLNKALQIEQKKTFAALSLQQNECLARLLSLICVLRSLLEKTLHHILTLSSSSSEDSITFTKKSETNEQ